jgi:hypothetical protein
MMEIANGIALWGAANSREKLIVTAAGRGEQLGGEECAETRTEKGMGLGALRGWAERAFRATSQ